MAKKYQTTTTLIIVESPAKCKKIEEYLGPGYKCLATFGHLRELKSLEHIDFNNNFKPSFQIIDNALKKKQIELLRSEIKKADDILLASDNDREGEAIAWHVCDLFGLNPEKAKRIIFNEITESALRKAVNNPTKIDMNMVRAQQARQILDILVGFKVSPVLWKCISKNSENSLSAGRCQTPALNIVYENQKDIDENPGKKVYNTTGYFTNKTIPFQLDKEHLCEDTVTDFLNESINFKHLYHCSEQRKSIKKAPEPLSTSRLQQLASNELHYSPKDTMKIAQKLYEAGYITYMRTDSKKYSKEFIEDIKGYIERGYGSTYISSSIDDLIIKENVSTTETLEDKKDIDINIDKTIKKTVKKKKETKEKKNKKDDNESLLVQNAHEAIRPTKIILKELPEDCDSKERRLYKLIWETSIESCMSDSIFLSITASIKSAEQSEFKYTSEKMDFPGWKIIECSADLEKENDKYFIYLQTIKNDTIIPYKKMVSKMNLKSLKSHYTEARLVQLLEEKGIGRPSTFSSLVDKIQERGYVKKDNIKGKEIMCKDYELEGEDIFEMETKREFGNEKNKLIIQNLGVLVIDFLNKNFDSLFNYDYTKNMENELDKIAENKKVWYELCNECLNEINESVNKMGELNKMEIKIDDKHSYIIGKHGPIIKCVEENSEDENNKKEKVTFKSVKKDIDVNKLKRGEYTLDQILEEEKKDEKSIGKYEGKDLYIKKGKYGLYVVWGVNTASLKVFGNRPIENIEYIDVLKHLENVKKYKEECSSDSDGSNKGKTNSKKYVNPNVVREISTNISIRKGKTNDYIFYKTKEMTKPEFLKLNEFKDDYKTCDKKVLKTWIKEKYNIV